MSVCVHVCVLYITDKVLSDDARWQNVLFYKCCCHWAAIRSTSKGAKSTIGVKENLGGG
jgi:hypothetical protein